MVGPTRWAPPPLFPGELDPAGLAEPRALASVMCAVRGEGVRFGCDEAGGDLRDDVGLLPDVRDRAGGDRPSREEPSGVASAGAAVGFEALGFGVDAVRR